MRRILACLAFATLLTGAPWPPLPAVAQQQPPQAPADAPGMSEPGRLGVDLQNLSKQSIAALGLAQAHALLVTFPAPGGPADRAGLQPGDVIVELEGAAVGPLAEVAAIIQRLGPGQTVSLGVMRGSDRLTLQARLDGPAPPSAPAGEQETTEQRIAAYEALLPRFRKDAFAQDLAPLRRRLGNAYANRSTGQRPENLGKALAAYEAAIQTLPPDLSKMPMLLARDFTGRPLSERVEQLETGIVACDVALTIFTRKAVPFNWGGVQRLLGPFYLVSFFGDATENIETAIFAYESALAAGTPTTQPRGWAGMQHTLADLYTIRKRGDRSQNIEKAIAAYEQALTVTVSEAQPREWVRTQLQLAEKHDALFRLRTNVADVTKGIETTIR